MKRTILPLLFVILISILSFFLGCKKAVPAAPVFSATPVNTATVPLSATQTFSPTVTTTPTQTNTGTITPTQTNTETITPTFTITLTATATSTVTNTPCLPFTFGFEGTINNYTQFPNGGIYFTKYTNTQNAKLTGFSVYCGFSGGNVITAIYTDSSAEVIGGVSGTGPGNLLAQTASIAVTNGWHTISLATPITIPPGDYWLAAAGSAGFSIGFNYPTSNISYWTSPITYGVLPATFSYSVGNSSFSTGIMAICECP